MFWLQVSPGSDKYRGEEAALVTDQRAIQQILQKSMASLSLTQLAIAAISIVFSILFVAANTDFCGSVFETPVGKLTHLSL